MKKFTKALLLIVLTSLLFITGCKKESSDTSENSMLTVGDTNYELSQAYLDYDLSGHSTNSTIYLLSSSITNTLGANYFSGTGTMVTFYFHPTVAGTIEGTFPYSASSYVNSFTYCDFYLNYNDQQGTYTSNTNANDGTIKITKNGSGFEIIILSTAFSVTYHGPVVNLSDGTNVTTK